MNTPTEIPSAEGALRTGEGRRSPLLGLTYRPHYATLIERAAACDLLQAIEIVPSRYVARGAAPRLARLLAEVPLPYSFHFVDNSVCSADFALNNTCQALAAFLPNFDPLFVSDHLTACRIGALDLETNLPPVRDRHSVELYAANLRRLAECVPPGIPLLIEHVPSYYAYQRDTLSLADFLLGILEGAPQVDLLLDLHNLYCDEENTGADAVALLEALPEERVRELHIAGGQRLPGGGTYVDTHGESVSPRVFELLELALERFGPELVVLERESNHADPEGVWRDLERAAELVGRAEVKAPGASERPRETSVEVSPEGASLRGVQLETLERIARADPGDPWWSEQTGGVDPELVTVYLRPAHLQGVRQRLQAFFPLFAAQAPLSEAQVLSLAHPTTGNPEERFELCFREVAALCGDLPEGVVWRELLYLERARYLTAGCGPEDGADLVAAVRGLDAQSALAGIGDEAPSLELETSQGTGLVLLRLVTNVLELAGGYSLSEAFPLPDPRFAAIYVSPTQGPSHVVFKDLKSLAVSLAFA